MKGLYEIAAFLNVSYHYPMDQVAARWYVEHPEVVKELQAANTLNSDWLGARNILPVEPEF